MQMISVAVMVLTLLIILISFALGRKRGTARSITRFILVGLSLVIALVVRKPVTDLILNMGGEQSILAELTRELTADESMTETMISVTIAVVELLIGLVAYVVIFFVALFLTWAIIFPICKIFVKKSKKEKPKKLVGGLIGLVQGILVCFLFFAPISVLLGHVDTIMTLGEERIESEESFSSQDPDFSIYTESFVGKMYIGVGGWYFDLLTQYEDKNGNKYTMTDLFEIAETAFEVADEMEDVSNSLDVFNSTESTDEQKTDALRDVAEGFKNVDNSIDGLSQEAKDLLQTIIDELAQETSGEGEDIDLEDLNLDEVELDTVANAIGAAAVYIDHVNGREGYEVLSEGTVETIVNGFAQNEFALDLFGDGDIPVDSEDEEAFVDAIENTSLSEENKIRLKQIFGLVTP